MTSFRADLSLTRALAAILTAAVCSFAVAWAAEPTDKSGQSLRAVGARPGASDSVEMGTLGEVDLARIGLLTEGQGGLSRAMWTGTSRTRAGALLKEIPNASRSRAMQGLARRLLLSEAEPPAGEDGSESLLSIRLGRLFAMGNLEAVKTLSERARADKAHEAEQKLRAEALLLSDLDKEACALGRTMRNSSDDPYWLGLSAFCDLRSGQSDSAELTVSLMRQNGVQAAPFYALYDAMAAGSAASASLSLPVNDRTALSFAMLKALGQQPLTAARKHPAFLRAIAFAPGGKAEERLADAENAASIGALPISSLKAIYALQAFDSAELAQPETAAAQMSSSRAHALFVAAADNASDPAQRVTIALAGLKRARADGFAPIMVQLLAPVIQTVSPNEALAWAAPDLVEAYLMLPAPEPAYFWFGQIARPKSDAEVRRVDRLANLLRIAAPDERLPTSESDLKRLIRHAEDQNSLPKLAFEIALLQALGTPIPDDVAKRLPALAPPPQPLAARLSELEQASLGGRVAEGALLSLIILGDEGPARAQPAIMVAVVKRLSMLGLQRDAREFALEAALYRP